MLYLHDGQNLFDGRTSFVQGRTWQVREQADAAIEAGEVEPLVIVGIYNTGDRRLAEYTHEYNWQMGGGEADAYGKLLTQELMPWIANEYRVRQDRENTGMGGSSLGGLVSLYLGLRHPEVFGKLALLSPSVWWNHKSILGYLNEHAPQLWERPRGSGSMWAIARGRTRCGMWSTLRAGSRRMGGGQASRCTSRRYTAEHTMKRAGLGG